MGPVKIGGDRHRRRATKRFLVVAAVATLGTIVAAGPTLADLMKRAGHASPAAAIRYQHATQDRDRVLADALGDLAARPPLRAVDSAHENPADFSRTSPATADGSADAARR